MYIIYVTLLNIGKAYIQYTVGGIITHENLHGRSSKTFMELVLILKDGKERVTVAKYEVHCNHICNTEK